MLLPRRSRTSLLHLFGSVLSCGSGHAFFPSHPVSFILFSASILPHRFWVPCPRSHHGAVFLMQLIHLPAARKLSGCAARSSALQDSCGEGRATLAATRQGTARPAGTCCPHSPTRILVHEVVISAAHFPQVKLHGAMIKGVQQSMSTQSESPGQLSTGKRRRNGSLSECPGTWKFDCWGRISCSHGPVLLPPLYTAGGKRQQ